MSNYGKKDLMEIVRQAKRENRTCAAFSRMTKAQLLAHAVSLNLVQSEAPAPVGSSKKNSLRQLERKAQNLVFATLAGNKKKSSFLRRVNRVLAMKDSDLTDDIMGKLAEDYNKLTSYG